MPDVFARRRGVCQDFAHLTIAGLRGLGLAARYVSGYLATEPPPGQGRVVGADATHAWLACWVPGPLGESTWLAVDPTNDCVVADRHVTVAWGRDYGDVPPVKGVIFTEATSSTMSVTVDVAPLLTPAWLPPGRDLSHLRAADERADAGTMSKPAILAVDDDAGVSRAIARDLRARYGADYRVIRATSGPRRSRRSGSWRCGTVAWRSSSPTSGCRR